MYLKLFASIVLSLFLMTACESDEANKQQDKESGIPQEAFDKPANSPANITDAEFNQFIAVMNEARLINMQAQSEMLKSLEEIGLDTQRYNKIFKEQQDPDLPVDATDEELKKFEQATEAFEDINVSNQSKIEAVLEKNDLTPERFQEIEMAIRTDPEVQKRFQELIQEDQQMN
jgi:hypothetical protein